MILTEDPTTWIVSRTGNQIEYENTDGKRWTITGVCNACGLCEEFSGVIGVPSTHDNVRIVDGEQQVWTRTLTWVNEPGTPGACQEQNFEQRKDIPITPDLVNSIEGCVQTGEWL